MPRRRRLEEHVNHERWLVSYADFITLLLALFVVMYALSRVNESPHQVLAGALVSAFGAKPDRRDAMVMAPDSVLPIQAPKRIPTPEPSRAAAGDEFAAKKALRLEEAQRQQRQKMDSIAREIMAAFGTLVENGQVRVIHSNVGLGVEINASVLFAPGQALLQQDSSRVIEAVAQVLKSDDHAIHVEGHTDNIPIVTEKFPSNWELSAVRASGVVRLLIDQGVKATRLTAVGYGEHRPVDSNDTEEGRLRNRRVTIMILSASPDELTEADIIPDTSPGSLPDTLPETLPGTLHDTGSGSRMMLSRL